MHPQVERRRFSNGFQFFDGPFDLARARCELRQRKSSVQIAAALRDHGLGESQIKFELFASAQPGRLQRRAVSASSS